MTKEARLRAARERVKRWKAAHPKSVERQRERRYQRQKEEVKRERVGVLVKVRVIEPVMKGSQETFLEHPAFTDGDVEVVGTHWRREEKRTGKQAPPRGGPLMEPNLKGGHDKDVGEADERSVSAKDSGGPEESRTPNEVATLARLEEFKAKRAARQGGVMVPPIRL